MLTNPKPPRIHLPKSWQDGVKSAVLHAIALADYAIVHARAWAADSINARVRLATQNDRLHEECALLRDELRIRDTRMAQIAPQRSLDQDTDRKSRANEERHFVDRSPNGPFQR